MSEVAKMLNKIGQCRMQAEVFVSFCRVTACALAFQTREEEYLEEAKRWKREELDAFGQCMGALINEMEDHPFEDRLGTIYMEMLGNNGAQRDGEFHTPKCICDIMTATVMADWDWPEEGEVSVSEPSCGGGAQILSLAEAVGKERIHRLRVQAVDVSRVACDMCYINTTLWSIPTVVIHGNTLSLETWGAWPNWAMIQNAPITHRKWMSMTTHRQEDTHRPESKPIQLIPTLQPELF